MNEIGFVVFASAALALLFASHLAARQGMAAIEG